MPNLGGPDGTCKACATSPLCCSCPQRNYAGPGGVDCPASCPSCPAEVSRSEVIVQRADDVAADVRVLIAEVERLRAVEHAARVAVKAAESTGITLENLASPHGPDKYIRYALYELRRSLPDRK